MILSKTSIISSLPVEASIVSAIKEMFNERAAADFIGCLQVTESVGVCVQVDNESDSHTWTNTSYFIATKIIGSNLIRVEYCSESKTEWHI